MIPRIDAASPLLTSHDTDLVVAHVGRHAVVLRPYELHEDDIVVTSTGAGLMPGGLQVPDDLFPVWSSQRVGSLVTVRTDARAMGMLERVDLRLPSVVCDPAAIEVATDLLIARDPGPHEFDWTGRAARLSRDALQGDRAGVEASVSSLIGRGAGSTPTGDDVIVGVSAALRMCGHDGPSATVAASAADLAHRTTRSSRGFLRAAERGSFSERVHGLALAFTDATAVPEAVGSLREWGATSGADLAMGMLGGLQWAMSKARSERSA